MRRVIDLSVALMEEGGEPIQPKISFNGHRRGGFLIGFAAKQDKTSLLRSAVNVVRGYATGRRIRVDDLPGGMGMAFERVQTETHHGTHVDAPYHYGPLCEGKPARTIDQLPLEWFYNPGVRLDLRHKPVGSTITVDDLRRALAAIGHTLRPLDIVMLWTGADQYWGRPEYLLRYCGLGREGTLWLLDQGVKVIGTDAWSLDRPPHFIEQDFIQTGDPGYLWPAHFAGREREYSQIEKLANLGALPAATGFTVACFPAKIKGATGGWTRAVAIVEDGVA
jgi:kynurenine formamidase